MPDREAYNTELEKQNGYCNCPDLSKLFERRKYAESLEAKCDFFKQNANLENPEPSDRQFLEDYREAAQQLEDAAQQYHRDLTTLATEGKLKFMLHDEEKCCPVGSISREVASYLLDKGEPIITIHCSECNQQIDLAD